MKTPTSLRLFLSAVLFTASCVVPYGARAATGDLYVTDSTDGLVLKFTPEGNKSVFATGLDAPRGLAFDRSGDLFVADSRSGLVVRITPAGIKSTFASGLWVSALAFDRAGNLFVTESQGAILKFTPAGHQTTFASGLKGPAGLAFDREGNLFVSDYALNRIVKFTPTGAESTFASIDRPLGLAFDAQGNLFAVDGNFGRIAKFTPTGAQSTFALHGHPHGLAFDGAGILFSAETADQTILKFTPAGVRSTFASDVTAPDDVAFEPAIEKLRNLSARGYVQSGDNVLIGGFILGGNALMNNAVLVRAIGPSLSNSGVANPLQDPTLELRDANGAVIASNNDWQDTQEAQIIASGIAPSDSRESAIFAALPAGGYSAIVRGANNATGVALVEVFSLH